MNEREWPFDYEIAQGPDGLTQVLDDMLLRTKTDPQFAAEEHYILYQLGQQRSLLKVDLSEQPFQFWYFDLLGRPATNAVKDVVAKFLWEKGGEKDRFQLDEIRG